MKRIISYCIVLSTMISGLTAQTTFVLKSDLWNGVELLYMYDSTKNTASPILKYSTKLELSASNKTEFNIENNNIHIKYGSAKLVIPLYFNKGDYFCLSDIYFVWVGKSRDNSLVIEVKPFLGYIPTNSFIIGKVCCEVVHSCDLNRNNDFPDYIVDEILKGKKFMVPLEEPEMELLEVVMAYSASINVFG